MVTDGMTNCEYFYALLEKEADPLYQEPVGTGKYNTGKDLSRSRMNWSRNLVKGNI